MSSKDKYGGGEPGLAQRIFLIGVVVFLAVKLAWVILPAPAMAVPRIGDDSLGYLWKARTNLFSLKFDSPAIRDIIRLFRLEDSASDHARAKRMRAVSHVTRIKLSPHEVLTGAMLDAGVGLRTAWTISEVVTALFLTAGAAVLLRALFGLGGAGVGLALLSTCFFPIQGLHFLIPGVLTLALAMLLWAGVMAGAMSGARAALLVAAMTSFHVIGAYYALMAIALAVLLCLQGEYGYRVAARYVIASVLGIAAISIAERLLVPKPVPVYIGKIDLSGIMRNLPFVPELMRGTAKTNLYVVLLALLFPWRRLISDVRLRTFAFVTTSALAGTLLFYRENPGEELELYIRVLVVFGILIAGLGGAALWERVQPLLKRERAAMPVAAGALAAGLLLWGFPKSVRRTMWEMFGNMNKRVEFVVEDVLEERIREMPERTTMVYLDMDIAMLASLLKGAYRLNALPLSMLVGSSSLKAELDAAVNPVFAAIPPRHLNTVAFSGFRGSLLRQPYRRMGVYLPAVREIAVNRPSEPLWLEVDNPDAELELLVQPGGCRARAPARSRAWIKLPRCSSLNTVVQLPDREAWIMGLATSQPKPGLHWPWGEPLVLAALPRNPVAPFKVDFSWPSIFEQNWGSDPVLPLLKRPLVPLSDDSGLLFFRAGKFDAIGPKA